jgi:hypothetical protein
MKTVRLIFLTAGVIVVFSVFVVAIECSASGMKANRPDSEVEVDIISTPSLTSVVELFGLQKDVNGVSSRYVITNQSSETGTLLHTYYDNADNPVGEAWTSELPAFEGQIYALQEIDDIPNGYIGYAIIISDALITGTVLSPPPRFVYLPFVTREPAHGVYVLNNYSAYVDTIGYLHIVGEVQNATASHLRFVKITANIFNSSGKLLDTDFTYTHLDNLPAGHKTCFHFSLEEPAGRSYYEFEAPTYWTDGVPLPNFAVFNDSGSYNSTFGWYEIIGQVRNDHGTRVEYVSPVGTVYNAPGVVVGCDFVYVNSTHLDPGQTSSFEMTFSGRNYTDVASYRLQVDGDLQ